MLQRLVDRSDKAIIHQEVNYYTIVCALKQNEAVICVGNAILLTWKIMPRVIDDEFHSLNITRERDYQRAISLK